MTTVMGEEEGKGEQARRGSRKNEGGRVEGELKLDLLCADLPVCWEGVTRTPPFAPAKTS